MRNKLWIMLGVIAVSLNVSASDVKTVERKPANYPASPAEIAQASALLRQALQILNPVQAPLSQSCVARLQGIMYASLCTDDFFSYERETLASRKHFRLSDTGFIQAYSEIEECRAVSEQRIAGECMKTYGRACGPTRTRATFFSTRMEGPVCKVTVSE